jgi:hypothetical protein
MKIDKLKLWVSSRYDFSTQSPSVVSLASLTNEPIFMYHSIGEGLVNGSSLVDVAEHVEMVTQAWHLKGSDQRECVTFTFDDGYRSALPAIDMLLHKGFRVIVFFPLCDPAFRYIPKDCLRIVLDRLSVGGVLHIGDMRLTVRCKEKHSRRLLAMRINRFLMKKFSLSDYNAIYYDFQHRYRSVIESPCAEHELMTPDELLPLLRRTNLLRLGAHGRSHYPFDGLKNPEEMAKEILEPRYELEKLFYVNIDCVAYPYGLYTPKVESYALKHYKSAYAVSNKNDQSGGCSLFRIGLDGKRLG